MKVFFFSVNGREDLMNLPRGMKSWTLDVGGCAPDFVLVLEAAFAGGGRGANGVRSFGDFFEKPI